MAVIDRKAHWETVHGNKAPEETSWYQSVPRHSLSMIAATGVGPEAALIDIGGGTSLLADRLLDQGFRDITVLDISKEALGKASRRLGDRAKRVHWIEADVTNFEPRRRFDLWHDRAAFHFLTDPEDRRAYMAALHKALVPAGHVIIAAFAPDGPEKCSGLPVVRYDVNRLSAELGPDFVLREQQSDRHITPAKREQLFHFFRFQKRNGAETRNEISGYNSEPVK